MSGRGRARSEPRFGLGTALVVSVVLHLILTVLGWWLPATSSEARVQDREDAVLRFTFAADPRDTPAIETPGELPVPQPTSRRQPAEPTTVVEAQRPQARPTRDAQIVPELTEPVDGGPDLGTESSMPQEDRAASHLSGTEAQGQRPSLDLGRAVQDFGEKLERSRPTVRRGNAPDGTFVPDAGQFPTTGYGMGNLTFETRDFDWSDYARQIYIAIWRAWHRRLYETVDDFEKWAYANGWFLNHENRIRFVIERSGQVSGIVVEGASGCAPLDLSATQALAEVILPPLPSDFPKDREVVYARFVAEGRIQDMRAVLSTLRRYGLF